VAVALEKTLTELRLCYVFFFFFFFLSSHFDWFFYYFYLRPTNPTRVSCRSEGIIMHHVMCICVFYNSQIMSLSCHAITHVSVCCCSVKGSTPKQSRPLPSRKCNSIASLLFCIPFFSFHRILYNDMVCAEAPRLSSQLEGKSRNDFLDVDFEERLKTVRRCTLTLKLFHSF